MISPNDITNYNLPYTISDLYYFRELVLTLFMTNSTIITDISDNSLLVANQESGLIRHGYIESGPHIGFEYLYDHKISSSVDIKNIIANSIVDQLKILVLNNPITNFSDLYSKLTVMNHEVLQQFIYNALDFLDLSTDNNSYYRILIT